MAEGSISVGQEQFSCPVCLDLLNNPVTIPCGHSYCMRCITYYWNQEDQKGVYSCPECRQTFSPRPILCKNVVFAEMVEKLKKTKLQAAVPAGAGDVVCDVCTGRKHKAIKSCLVCLESYCQTHFDRHEEFRSGNPHKVIDATGRLQQMICPQHHKQLEIYCQTDKCCICYLCTMEGHKNHDTITAVAERTKRQKYLDQNKKDLQQSIQNIEAHLQQLREDVKTHKRSAQKAVEDSERNFTELISSIKRSRSEVTQLIRDQEKAAVCQAEKHMKQLENEIDDLKKRITELKQLSHTEDHIHFLQSFDGRRVIPYFNKFRSVHLYDDVGRSVSLFKEKLKDFCKKEIQKISGTVKNKEIIRKEVKQLSQLNTLKPTRIHAKVSDLREDSSNEEDEEPVIISYLSRRYKGFSRADS